MNNDFAVRVENLSKRYRIGLKDSVHETLVGALTAWFKKPVENFRRLNKLSSFSDLREEKDVIWALKDVSFEVKHGEVIGIIGRNGAGKSTLLKILSNITEPTSGSAIINGRVASLLEVGTGFHPDLTGRENVYLNGTILGMKKKEIDRKFDEIVAFAGIEKFIDTPIRHYSSGMSVRLAFAVAAHLEPEILLIDEVLAVGDAEFQKKCLGKMGEVARTGRTILFVSHDMTNISILCKFALLLETGNISMQGNSKEVISCYLNQNKSGLNRIRWDLADAPGDKDVKITGVKVCRGNGANASSFTLAEPILIEIEYDVGKSNLRINPVVAIKNSLGLTLFTTSNYEDPAWAVKYYEIGRYKAFCLIPAYIFNEGSYHVDALIVHDTRVVRASVIGAIEFSIHDDGSTRGAYVGDWSGLMRPRCSWSNQVADAKQS